MNQLPEGILELKDAIAKGDPKVLNALANFLQKPVSELSNLISNSPVSGWDNFSKDFDNSDFDQAPWDLQTSFSKNEPFSNGGWDPPSS